MPRRGRTEVASTSPGSRCSFASFPPERASALDPHRQLNPGLTGSSAPDYSEIQGPHCLNKTFLPSAQIISRFLCPCSPRPLYIPILPNPPPTGCRPARYKALGARTHRGRSCSRTAALGFLCPVAPIVRHQGRRSYPSPPSPIARREIHVLYTAALHLASI